MNEYRERLERIYLDIIYIRELYYVYIMSLFNRQSRGNIFNQQFNNDLEIEDGVIDARQSRIINVKDAVNESDAVNLGQIQNNIPPNIQQQLDGKLDKDNGNYAGATPVSYEAYIQRSDDSPKVYAKNKVFFPMNNPSQYANQIGINQELKTNKLTNDNDFSFEGWFKNDRPQNHYGLFQFNVTTFEKTLSVWVEDDALKIQYGGGVYLNILNQSPIPKKKWFHLCITIDNTNEEIKFYLNGRSMIWSPSYPNKTIEPLFRDGMLFSVGYYKNQTSNQGHSINGGYVRNFRLWSKVLSLNEVIDAWRTPQYPQFSKQALVGQWDFQTIRNPSITSLPSLSNIQETPVLRFFGNLKYQTAGYIGNDISLYFPDIGVPVKINLDSQVNGVNTIKDHEDRLQEIETYISRLKQTYTIEEV